MLFITRVCYSCLILLGVIFSSPFWGVGVLVLQTLVVVVWLRLFQVSLWSSFLLFLVFLGGILVVFIYICGLAGDREVDSSYLDLWKSLSCLLLVVIVFKVGSEINFFLYFQELNREESYDTVAISLYRRSSILVFSFIVLYLFLALLSVVKLIDRLGGPLRKTG